MGPVQDRDLLGPVQVRTYWDPYKTVLTGTRTRPYLLGPDKTVLTGTRTRPCLLGPAQPVPYLVGPVQDSTYWDKTVHWEDRTYWDPYKTVLSGTRTRPYLLGPVQDRAYWDPYKTVLSGQVLTGYKPVPYKTVLTGTRKGPVQTVPGTRT